MARASTRRDLTLIPSIIKVDLHQAGRERQRIAAEYGRLVVPEKRTNPRSQMIELAFVRVKSTSEHPGPPLVFLAGGPGISGIDALRWENLAPWFAALREVGDVIALDQRGTGLSLPCLDCLENWDLPLDQPGSAEQVLRLGRERVQKSVDFWHNQDVDLSGYVTTESADDINDLREALGYTQVNLYGASYGSHLALATIRRHPTRIARAVIAMVEGPDHTAKLPGNIQKHLENLHDLARTDPGVSAAVPDLLGLMRDVLARLEAEPVEVEVTDEGSKQKVTICLGKYDLQRVTASGIGSQRFIGHLPARYYAMSLGDFSWLAHRVLIMRRDWIGNAMTYMMDCASGASPERARRIAEEARETLLGGLIDFPFMEICDAWGNPDLGPAYRTNFTSEVPTLFMSGTLDGRTPISNADEVRCGFTHHHHLIVENATHSTEEIVTAPGVTAAINDFLCGKPDLPTRSKIPFTFAPIPTH